MMGGGEGPAMTLGDGRVGGGDLPHEEMSESGLPKLGCCNKHLTHLNDAKSYKLIYCSYCKPNVVSGKGGESFCITECPVIILYIL